jgi:DNA-binding transcriptional ArsR family regulator
MDDALENFRPTLWRTCRALANTRRLQILQYVVQHPGVTVSHVAENQPIALPTASVYLRAMNARGLLKADRDGREVYYRAKPDRTLPEAARILAAVVKTLESRDPDPLGTVYHLATAFTHPRRIHIVRTLRGQALTPRELGSATAIPKSALLRHLGKLSDRGFISTSDGRSRHLRQSLPLGKTLLSLACAT